MSNPDDHLERLDEIRDSHGFKEGVLRETDKNTIVVNVDVPKAISWLSKILEKIRKR